MKLACYVVKRAPVRSLCSSFFTYLALLWSEDLWIQVLDSLPSLALALQAAHVPEEDPGHEVRPSAQPAQGAVAGGEVAQARLEVRVAPVEVVDGVVEQRPGRAPDGVE